MAAGCRMTLFAATIGKVAADAAIPCTRTVTAPCRSISAMSAAPSSALPPGELMMTVRLLASSGNSSRIKDSRASAWRWIRSSRVMHSDPDSAPLRHCCVSALLPFTEDRTGVATTGRTAARGITAAILKNHRRIIVCLP